MQMISRHFTRRYSSTFNSENPSSQFFFQIYEIYPYLQNYANNWAVSDFLLVYLKNKAQATKKK
jgi:hypothetical protein